MGPWALEFKMGYTVMVDDTLPLSQPALVELGSSQRVEDETMPVLDDKRVSDDAQGDPEGEIDPLVEAM
ncbi:hypothetical protein ACEPAG_9419 [Sanghuangporus baumii]